MESGFVEGIGDGAEEGEVESEEEEEQGEGGGQEDGTGEQDVESRDTDESAPSESEVRLSVGPTVLSAGDGTALTGVPSTSQASLESGKNLSEVTFLKKIYSEFPKIRN